jgi:hypothetical protein
MPNKRDVFVDQGLAITNAKMAYELNTAEARATYQKGLAKLSAEFERAVAPHRARRDEAIRVAKAAYLAALPPPIG